MLESDTSVVEVKSIKTKNPYIKIIEEKHRKSKLIKTGSGSEVRLSFSKSKFVNTSRNDQQARTLTEIPDGMVLPRLKAKKKKKSSSDLNNISQLSDKKY